MEKPVLAIDIDDVLAHFIHDAMEKYNSISGKNIPSKVIPTYNLSELWGCSIEEVQEFLRAYIPQTKRLNPVEGSREAIETLRDSYKLVAVTMRPYSLQNVSVEWLDKNYPESFNRVISVGSDFYAEPIKSKAEVCLEIGARALVDDGLDNCIECVERGIPAYLFVQQWNQRGFNHKLLKQIPVPHWKNILEHLL